MMNPIGSLLGRARMERADARAALRGVLGGVLAAALASGALGLAGMVNPYMDDERDHVASASLASHVEGLSWVGAAVWSEAWVPSEWRAWARPGHDLSWPPEEPWRCPPGAYCCPELPVSICQLDPRDWRASTPPCPFAPAPLAELPWALSSHRGDTLDSTGQPIWLGCEAREGKWRIVQIGPGPDGEPLTEDDDVRGCLGPQLGWPREYIGGWPVEESRAQAARADEAADPNASARGGVAQGSRPRSASPR